MANCLQNSFQVHWRYLEGGSFVLFLFLTGTPIKISLKFLCTKKLYSDTIFLCIDARAWKGQYPPLWSLTFVLGLVGYGNDHFMLERTEFNKLTSDCKEKQYRSLNAIFFCLLKQYTSSLKNNFVFLTFVGLQLYSKCAPTNDICIWIHTMLAHNYPNEVDAIQLVSDSNYAYSITNSTLLIGFLSRQISIQHLFYETAWSIPFWNHKNDVTRLVKFCMENTSRRRVFSVNFNWACDVIFKVSK